MTMPSMRAKYIAQEAVLQARLKDDPQLTDLELEDYIEAFALGHMNAAVEAARSQAAAEAMEMCAKIAEMMANGPSPTAYAIRHQIALAKAAKMRGLPEIQIQNS